MIYQKKSLDKRDKRTSCTFTKVSDIVIYGGFVMTMDRLNTFYTLGWIQVFKDRIVGLGSGQPPKEVIINAKKIIKATGKVVLPGLINGHTHLSQSFMRGIGEGLNLLSWLKHIKPFQASMTPRDMELASLLGLVENLRCGVTSVVQHHKITSSREHVEASLRAAYKIGLRFLLARGWRDFGESKETQKKIMREMERLLNNWHKSANGRLTLGFGPMVPWRCSDETMCLTLKAARTWGLSTHIHIAETQEEVEIFQKDRKLRHVEWLEKMGALGSDIQLVHCIWINDAELTQIAKSESVVIHCPVSNMYLASGIAQIRKMLDKKIIVALGTDGSASNNNQDMLITTKIATLLARIGTSNAAAISSEGAIRMATINGTYLFNRHDLGSLTLGNKADITIVDLNTVRSIPFFSLANAFVHTACGSDVHTVIVDGKILLDAGRVTVINETELLVECQKAAGRLVKRVGVRLQ